MYAIFDIGMVYKITTCQYQLTLQSVHNLIYQSDTALFLSYSEACFSQSNHSVVRRTKLF